MAGNHGNTLQVGTEKSKLRVVYSYLGNVHYSLGNYGRAMEYHRQVRAREGKIEGGRD